MTEEIRYIANLQRQEEFDNEVTELKDALKRLEQENKELLEARNHFMGVNLKYFNALEEIREIAEKSLKISYNLEVNSMLYDIKHKINEVLK